MYHVNVHHDVIGVIYYRSKRHLKEKADNYKIINDVIMFITKYIFLLFF